MNINEKAFFQYISEQLHSHVRVLTPDYRLLHTYSSRADLEDTFPFEVKDRYIPAVPTKFPTVGSINNLLTYLTVPTDEFIIIIGPLAACPDAYLQIQYDDMVVPASLVKSLCFINANELTYLGTTIYNMFSENQIDRMDCYNRNFTGSYTEKKSMSSTIASVFDVAEYGDSHKPYSSELYEQKCIEAGDIQLLKAAWNRDIKGTNSVLSKNYLTNCKYLAITTITDSAKSAIRGGAEEGKIFLLCDSYCQQIDELPASRIMQLEMIVRNAQLAFTRMVAQQKKRDSSIANESPITAKAKDYIFANMHRPLTVKEVAEALKVNPSYLNVLFRKANGMTVHEYILSEKVKLAGHMLRYSDYSYSTIAAYLGFSSQSHLGSVFKSHTGTTMKAYRCNYKSLLE